LNIDAGLNDTGVVYFIIDDGTQTIFPEVAANDTSSSTDKATTESEKPATADNATRRFLQTENTTTPATNTSTPAATNTTTNTTKNTTTVPTETPPPEDKPLIIEAEDKTWSEIVYQQP